MMLLAAIAAAALSMLYLVAPVQAADKATICHATSGSNEFVVITIDEGASAFPHLDDNGSPLNGHEDDFLLEGEASVEDCQEAAHSSSPSPSEAEESVAESEAASGEQSVEAGTGTPEESVNDGAFSLNGAGPLPTIAFSLILLASLGALAYANVKSVRSRI
jgi:uncharacterized protein involved in copper resistance